ncbi:MAG: alpha-L-fucosidase [Rhodopirellula sp.]|nr:alpha-L-fucosidase [Rhodopirellula sp.]
MRFRVFAIALLLGLSCVLPSSAADSSWNKETDSQRDARMQWWRDARFGMFIHWGLYAIPAGTWDGKQVPGIGEWIMDRANIPVDKYEKLAAQFNPAKYDPAAWAQIAADAGMKYLVITSKHHDGFCLFATDTTDYDVVNATAYGKDLLKPLAEECRKRGIQFCTYYSIMDWHHPAQMRGSEQRHNPTKIRDGRKQEYMDYMKAQFKDLLASCDPAVLWFDGEWPDWYTEEDGREIYAYLRGLKPEIIVNNRVGKGRKGMEGINKANQDYVGDFGTPEQQIPATGLDGVDWESCMTMNETWGFRSDDENWKSAETLIRNLIDIVSKGGNYLLNIGPTAAGEIPAASVGRLAAIGRWMQANGQSIYGAQASPFEKTPWGRCTRKPMDGKTRLYLHVFQWPEGGNLVVPKVPGAVVAAKMLAGGEKLSFAEKDGDVRIALPSEAPDKTATVVVLDVKQQ